MRPKNVVKILYIGFELQMELLLPQKVDVLKKTSNERLVNLQNFLVSWFDRSKLFY